MKQINILTKAEVTKEIEESKKKLQKEFYIQLQKVHNKMVDLEQIIKLNIFGK